MAFHNRPADRQAEPSSGVLPAVQPLAELEDALNDSASNRVRYPAPSEARLPAGGADFDFGRLRSAVDERIPKQVFEELDQPVRVAVYLR